MSIAYSGVPVVLESALIAALADAYEDAPPQQVAGGGTPVGPRIRISAGAIVL